MSGGSQCRPEHLLVDVQSIGINGRRHVVALSEADGANKRNVSNYTNNKGKIITPAQCKSTTKVSEWGCQGGKSPKVSNRVNGEGHGKGQAKRKWKRGREDGKGKGRRGRGLDPQPRQSISNRVSNAG